MSTGLAEIRWLLFSICQIKYSIYSLNIPKNLIIYSILIIIDIIKIYKQNYK